MLSAAVFRVDIGYVTGVGFGVMWLVGCSMWVGGGWGDGQVF